MMGADKIARDCFAEYMRDDSVSAYEDFLRIVGKAIADAHAAGYRAGVEAAAVKLSEMADDRERKGLLAARTTCLKAADAIRALIPDGGK